MLPSKTGLVVGGNRLSQVLPSVLALRCLVASFQALKNIIHEALIISFSMRLPATHLSGASPSFQQADGVLKKQNNQRTV
jgi:hypothetical protein